MVMAIAEEEEKANVYIVGENLKQEKQFRYLGIIVEEKDKLEPETNKRMGKVMRITT